MKLPTHALHSYLDMLAAGVMASKTYCPTDSECEHDVKKALALVESLSAKYPDHTPEAFSQLTIDVLEHALKLARKEISL